MHQLDSQSHQKLQQLKNQDRDGGEVVEWLRSNKDKFRMEIFEPAVLCMTVPNRAYADAVEACFGGSQLKVSDSSGRLLRSYFGMDIADRLCRRL